MSDPTPAKLPPCPRHDPEGFEKFLSDSDATREHFRRDSREAPETFVPSVVKGSSVQISSASSSSPYVTREASVDNSPAVVAQLGEKR